MTFDEALDKKKEIGYDRFTEGVITYHIFVIPKKTADLKEYLDDVRHFFGDLTDDHARDYSSDGQYEVKGLYTDGVYVMHTPIVE